MAPLPKKKHAKSRTRTRKASILFSLPKLVVCPNCQALRLPHRVCPSCGFYGKKGKHEEGKRPTAPNKS